MLISFMDFLQILLLNITHSILEFLPVSSSFFISKIFINNYNLLLHGISGVVVYLFFIKDIKDLINNNFIIFVSTFILSLSIHFAFANNLLFILLTYMIFVLLKLINSIFFIRYSMYFFIYLMLISASYLINNEILFTHSDISNIFTHIFAIIIMIFSLFLNDSSNNTEFNFSDAILLSSLCYISHGLCISRLGIIITYLSFKKLIVKDVIKYSLLLSGIVNLLCLAFVVINSFGVLNIHMDGSEIPNNNNIFYFLPSILISIPFSLGIIYSLIKKPYVVISLSILIRLSLLLYTNRLNL